MKKALVIFGGWEGHDPDLVSKRFARVLDANNFEVGLSNSLDSFLDVKN